jgi:IS66 Orf2 like protein
MLTLPASVRVFVARGATDLRRSFDRLSAQVQEVLRQDPLLCGGPRYVAGHHGPRIRPGDPR